MKGAPALYSQHFLPSPPLHESYKHPIVSSTGPNADFLLVLLTFQPLQISQNVNPIDNSIIVISGQFNILIVLDGGKDLAAYLN
jgi:hypothetical protein